MPRASSDAREAAGDSAPRGRDRNKPLYMISVAAELTGMHPQTLRVYEQKGLVTPGRSRGNTRLYSQADIERLNLISKLTDEGINLAGVVRILDMRERMLEREAELDDLRARIRQLEDAVHEYKGQPRAGHAPPAAGRGRRREERGLAPAAGRSNRATSCPEICPRQYFGSPMSLLASFVWIIRPL